jgi:tetratricopeptide (TPR) repeat protein
LLHVSVASAQPSYRDAKDAARQFENGRALLKTGQYAEACTAFARSQQLDPQHGTLYNLAGCYHKRGMLVSARNAYRDLAARDKNPKRRADATLRAKQLEAILPRLRIVAPSAGWTVTLNGVDVSGLIDSENPVDPGAYEIVATMNGEPAFRTTITMVADGQRSTVAIRAKPALDVVDPFGGTAAALPHPVLAAKPAPADPERVRNRRFGLIAMAGGGAFFLTGLAFGKAANDKWSEANDICGGMQCVTTTELALGNELAERARARGYAATGLVLGGAALGGLGAWLYWKSTRSDKIQVRPGTGSTTAGVTIEGWF